LGRWVGRSIVSVLLVVVSAGAVLPQDKWAAEGLSSGHADLPKFRFEIDDVDPSWPGGIYPGDPPRRSPAAK
jgi:hypothetical protein